MLTEDSTDLTVGDPLPALTLSGSEQALAFFDSDVVGEALRSTGWSAERDLRMLVDIMEDEAGDPKVRLLARREFRALLRESLTLSGRLHQLVRTASTETTGPNGQTIKLVQRDVQLLQAGRAGALQALHTLGDSHVTQTEPSLDD